MGSATGAVTFCASWLVASEYGSETLIVGLGASVGAAEGIASAAGSTGSATVVGSLTTGAGAGMGSATGASFVGRLAVVSVGVVSSAGGDNSPVSSPSKS